MAQTIDSIAYAGRKNSRFQKRDLGLLGLTPGASKESRVGSCFAGRGLLAHLGQGPAVPDGDGDSAQSRRSGEQQAGSPEIPLLRGGRGLLVLVDRTGSLNVANLRKGTMT